MTTGNVVRDGTWMASANCNGSPTSIKVGPYFSKKWSGANHPAVPKEYKYLKDPSTGKIKKLRVFRRRQLMPLPYSCTVIKDILPLFQYRAPVSGNPPATPCVYEQRICNAGFTTKPSFTNPWTANDDLKLLEKLHEKIWGSGFDPGVFLAEAGKGLTMITDAATKLSRSLTYIKRGQLIKAWNVLGQNPKYVPPSVKKSNANMWAEYRWGWTPLLNDAYDGAVWVAHQVAAPMVFRLAVRLQRVRVGTVNAINSPTYLAALCTARKQIIAYLRESPPSSPLNAINPASIAWELVPYSFVADWFIPIGTYLKVRGLPSQLKGTFVTSSKVMKIAEGYQNHGPASFGCPAHNAISLLQDPYYEYTTFNRTIDNSLSHLNRLPTFRGFEKVATWKHAVDAVALVVQKLKSH